MHAWGMARTPSAARSALGHFHEATRAWFVESFGTATEAQAKAWPAIARGESTLLLAPTGSGKTLAAFLSAIDSAVFAPAPPPDARLKVLYVSPLKALAIDIERNLRAPLAGILRTAAVLGASARPLEIGVRTGDTDARERARLQRHPPDILITTPESLYLLLTSNARAMVRHVDVVIIDEIHAVLPTKRGVHLMLSMERLEALRREGEDGPSRAPLQRIGLSATQKPLDEVARLLGGFDVDGHGKAIERAVTIADARAPKPLELVIEVPVEDMAELARGERVDPLDHAVVSRSIWPEIHPRLVELVRGHRSTMIFVNSRRLAERLATALNELAGDEIALAHHGSVAREQRQVIEERLKQGLLPCIVATSSLELGLDLGAVDLVVLIEAPPSVAAGLQRVGRASHQVGGTSKGVLFPKHRSDLLASAATAERMKRGDIETTRYPRNPLDVLAQQIVAEVSVEALSVDELHRRVRGAAPFVELTRSSLESVLDMLSGRYPSDDFAELRPRITWDRVGGILTARAGAKQLAILNAGVIPDRGLYGVFLADGGQEDPRRSRRVGELDEEMVFEAREGDVFLLGASSWRIAEITHDRVLVVPAPGEPGKMPFWHGDRPGRSAELGQAIGALTGKLAKLDDEAALALLTEQHHLDTLAAANLVRFVRDQRDATSEVPSDRTIVIERFRDELGDHRVCILSPYGARVHAALATAISTKARDAMDLDVEAVWTDEGIVLRFADRDEAPAITTLLPDDDELDELLTRGLGQTPLFAGRFRECAGRALLLPRKNPKRRAPLWAQRKRAADLLGVAAKYPAFPIVLEAYRECLADTFDVPALRDLLTRIAERRVRLHVVDTDRPSPFAASVLFSYVANFIYETDAPIAERRAAALSIDPTQLRELLGEVDLREVLDESAFEELERRLQHLGARLPHADAVHDLLLALGDLTLDEIVARGDRDRAAIERDLEALASARRILSLSVGGEARWVAAEDASRYRDALGCALPPGLPIALLEKTAEPVLSLVQRYARTHVPFRAADVSRRFGLAEGVVHVVLTELVARRRLMSGELTPGRRGEEYCDAEVLKQLRRRSLAKLRAEIEPVDPSVYARFAPLWHGLDHPRHGVDALMLAVERLEGLPLSLEALEHDVLPARVRDYQPSMLDVLLASGAVTWRGFEALTTGGGRIALYTTERFRELAPTPLPVEQAHAAKVLAFLEQRGASFFHEILREVGGFGPELLEALYALVWNGHVTNDTLLPLRQRNTSERDARRGEGRRPLARHTLGRAHAMRGDRRLTAPRGSEGRWSVLPKVESATAAARIALAETLLHRHGVLTRESLSMEDDIASFGRSYEILRTLEEGGRIRRGYFVAGLGATQFAVPGADELLRSQRDAEVRDEDLMVLASTDPAQSYGASLRWPTAREGNDGRPQRATSTYVILHGGRLVAWVGKHGRSVMTFAGESGEALERREVERLARGLAKLVDTTRRPIVVERIDGQSVGRTSLAKALLEVGFRSSLKGYVGRPGAVVVASASSGRGGPPRVAPAATPTTSIEPGDDDLEGLFDDDELLAEGEATPEP